VVTQREGETQAEQDAYYGTPVYRFPFWQVLEKKDVGQVMELRQRIIELKRTMTPGLTHINFLGPSVLFHFQTAKACPTPLLLSMDSALLEGVSRGSSLAGHALRSADWVTCVSSERLARARRLVPEIGQRSSVVYNGCDMPSVQPAPLSIRSPRILCLGRLDPVKGFDIAVKAFPSIVARFPNARLIIAGDGPARAQLESQIATMGLEDIVDMVGWVLPEKVPALLNRATIVMMPSHDEGLPLVSLEAAQMARPVVASAVGGLKEVVLHKQSGLLVDPEDSGAFASAVIYLLQNPEKAVQMGEHARQRVSEIFSWNQYTAAYGALYKRLHRVDKAAVSTGSPGRVSR
jgi:glycogen(starch) synthase